MDHKLPVKAFKKGGVHPHDSKLTAALPIQKANMPKRIRIPMAMQLGAPAKVLVKAGDKVQEGQLIGEASGFVSANVHASVSGTVVAVEKGNTLNVKGAEYVVIETGGSIPNWYERRRDWSALSPEQIVQAVKDAGIVGLGGATFPTHVKLSPPKDKKIELLVVNGAECEPFLTIDHRMMLEKAEEILEGVRILMKALGVSRSVIGIEANKEDAIELFWELAGKEGASGISVAVLRTRYPQGGEKQLVQAVTGREVPSMGLPLDVGVLVENVSTVHAVYEAVVFQKPLIERGVTFAGPGVAKAGNYKVRIGTTFQEFFNDYGIPAEHGAVIAGGPMMGIEIPDFNLSVTKGVSGIVVLPKRADYQVRNKPCIRCAKCLTVCPMRLQPTELAKLCDALAVEDAAAAGLMDCMECGACAFVCPSTIPIVGLIRYGKEFWKRKQVKK